MRKIILTVFVVGLTIQTFAQNTDKAKFVEYQPGFYQNSILKDNSTFEETQKPVKVSKRFTMDVTGKEFPNKVNLYKYAWHNIPISQGNTGTCWCYSATSMIESDIYRISGKKFKLSEMWTVYWEYVEKAKYFVKTRGESLFAEGSEANAVIRIYTKYGIVPESSYKGLQDGRIYNNHEPMFNEMYQYLQSVKEANLWNEEIVVSTIKSIMNFYIGEPPTEVVENGTKYSPMDYMNNVLKLIPADYVDILSILQDDYYIQTTYDVPDNWWEDASYYNVPLDIYMKTIKQALLKGFTMSVGGDVSEAGLNRELQVAVIPSFDIPSASINEEARQFRFSNKTTTDDHGMHIVGYVEKNGVTWFLVKDSSAGSRNNDAAAPEFGYYFFHEDYVKLKMMDFLIHKEAVSTILGKVKTTENEKAPVNKK